MKRRQPKPADVEPTAIWPEMRIARQVDLADDANGVEWHGFLDNLGRENYGRGKARSLGSMALVYVPAREMGIMLSQRYPRDYASRSKTSDLQRKVADGVNDFVRNSFGRGFQAQTDELEAAHFLIQAATDGFTMSNEIDIYDEQTPGLPQVDLDDPLQLARVLEADVTCPSQPTMFGNANLDVKGISLFGKDGYGLDLTPNDNLYDERSALAGYLRSAEGLNTSVLNSGWKPHATVFDFEEHIAVGELIHERQVPPDIHFEQPRPIVL